MNKKFELDDKLINKLKMKIIFKEQQNLRDRKLNDSKMVEWIKSKIEEEIKCCLKD